MEVPLFVSAVIFAVVFDRECLCPRDWQWQVGIVAVFLVWIDLLLYMRRMRILGTVAKPQIITIAIAGFMYYAARLHAMGKEGLCMNSACIIILFRGLDWGLQLGNM